MDIEDKAKLLSLYQTRFKELGHDVRAIGWNDKATQELRFKVLCDIADLSGSSICDIGCGFGDLYPYLKNRFGTVSYKGIDIVPEFVAKAKELNPECAFECLDILENRFEEPFDFFVASGALSFKIKDNMTHAKNIISKMFECSKKGVSINFLSSYVNYQLERNYHYQPEVLFSFAKSLSKRVTLRHDYPLWEFTLYIYR